MKFLLQTLTLCMVLHVHTYAQHTVTQDVKKDIEWLDIAPTTKLTAKELVQNKTVLSLPENHTLNLVSTYESRNGYRQYRYRQYYNGIPIIGADYIVHEKNAQVKKIRKKAAKNIQPNTQTSINEEVARQAALHHIDASRYAWEDATHEGLLKKVKSDEQATFFPTANLVFFNPNTKSEADYRLAYRFDIFALSPMRRAMVYIDAVSAEVLAVHDKISCADEQVSGLGTYHGEVDFTAHREGDNYIYKNNIGGGIKVHSCNHTEHYSNEEITESDTLFPQDPVR